MHQGHWKCSRCGGDITELPFVPRSEAGLTCRSCFAKGKGGSAPRSEPVMAATSELPDIPFDAELATEPPPFDDLGMDAVPVSTEKQKVSGSWTCATCGGAITSLPFTPKSTNNLKCLDCFKRSRA